MPSSGVNWYFPANGIKTLPAPIDASNRSESPFWQQTSSLDKFSENASFKGLPFKTSGVCSR